MSVAVPPLAASHLGRAARGSATRLSWVRFVQAWGPSSGPTACALAGRRCALWGWRKGVPGGVPFAVVRVKVKVTCSGALRTPAYP